MPHLVEPAHRRQGYAVLKGHFQQFGLGVLQQPLLNVAVNLIPILIVHHGSVSEARFLRPLGSAHQLQQPTPLPSLRGANEDVPILAAQDAVGVGKVQCVMPCPAGNPPLVHRHQSLGPVVQPSHRLDFGNVDVLTLPAVSPGQQRHDDG